MGAVECAVHGVSGFITRCVHLPMIPTPADLDRIGCLFYKCLEDEDESGMQVAQRNLLCRDCAAKPGVAELNGHCISLFDAWSGVLASHTSCVDCYVDAGLTELVGHRSGRRPWAEGHGRLTFEDVERQGLAEEEYATNKDVKAFGSWFRRHSDELASQAPDQAASAVVRVLQAIDPRLGAEITSEPRMNGWHQLVLTASREPSLFTLVEGLRAAVAGVARWNVVALKQPFGFDFSPAFGIAGVNAKTLGFAPTPGVHHGITLVVSDDIWPTLPSDVAQREELQWRLVVTGIGEALSAMLQHLDSVSCTHWRQAHGEPQPIEGLAPFLLTNSWPPNEVG